MEDIQKNHYKLIQTRISIRKQEKKLEKESKYDIIPSKRNIYTVANRGAEL